MSDVSPPRSSVAAELVLRVAAAVGLGVSALLLWEYLTPAADICGPGGGCDMVRQSAYASILGVPTPAFGVLFFGAVFAMSHFHTPLWRQRLRAGAVVGGLVGVALLVIQAFVLDAFCTYCVAADVAAIAVAVCAVASRGAVSSLAPATRVAMTVAAGLGLAAPIAIGLAAGAKPAEPPPPSASVPSIEEIVPREPGVATLVEFIDFECPFCRKLHHELKPVLRDYRGRVRVVRKHVPLPNHTNAVFAARAACCAEEQGRGDEMADALFQSHDLSPSACEQLAARLGLDVEAFRACFASDATTERLRQDAADATRLEINALPTFFIGTERFRGPQPESLIRDSLDRALTGPG
jgi:protein-disulfide isomerase